MTMQKVAQALEEALTDYHPNDAKIREALAFVRALLRPDAQGERGGWRPIESAPKDRLIVVWAPSWQGLLPLMCCCSWHPDAGFCIDELRPPTLWMECEDALHLLPPGIAPSTPSPSDWEAGAIRERILKCADQGIISWNIAQEVANHVLSLPIPRRP